MSMLLGASTNVNGEQCDCLYINNIALYCRDSYPKNKSYPKNCLCFLLLLFFGH